MIDQYRDLIKSAEYNLKLIKKVNALIGSTKFKNELVALDNVLAETNNLQERNEIFLSSYVCIALDKFSHTANQTSDAVDHLLGEMTGVVRSKYDGGRTLYDVFEEADLQGVFKDITKLCVRVIKAKADVEALAEKLDWEEW